MQKFRAALFDLDGTLTDTVRDISTSMNYALEQFDLPQWEIEDYKFLAGNGVKALARGAVRDRQDLAEAVQRVYQARYEVHDLDTSRPFDGIPELLQELRRRGLRLTVFSNKPHADTLRVVEHFFPEKPFDIIRGQIEGVPVKPDPSGALAIAQELSIPPEEFLYFGDTNTDMRCACAAGMYPIGVLWGFRSKEELLENGVRTLLSKPEELWMAGLV